MSGTFFRLALSNNAHWLPMTDAWQNHNDDSLVGDQAVNTNTDRLCFTRGHKLLLVLLGAIRGNRFRATFALRMGQTYALSGGDRKLYFLFNVKDAEHADGVMLFVGPGMAARHRWYSGRGW